MSSSITALCDLCGYSEVVKRVPPISESEWAEELRQLGWWYRPGDGIRDVCPRHPHGGDNR